MSALTASQARFADKTLPHNTVVEVCVSWGDTVLGVKHLSALQSFRCGEEASNDLVLSVEQLGRREVTLVAVAEDGQVRIQIPEAAQAWVCDQGKITHILALEKSPLRVQSLLTGAVAVLGLGNLSLRISVTKGQPLDKCPPNLSLSKGMLVSLALSFAAHLCFLLCALLSGPPLGLTDDPATERERIVLLQQYLNATAEREREVPWDAVLVDHLEQEGGSGTRANGEEGSLGTTAVRTPRIRGYGIEGPRENRDTHIAMKAAQQEASQFGLIGLLNTGAGGDPYAPVAPWARDESLGADPLSARGNLWGDSIGEVYGAGGFGLSGIGEGGGGRGEGLGLGAIKTIGKGAGTGTARGFGPGSYLLGLSGTCDSSCGGGNGSGVGYGVIETGHHSRPLQARVRAFPEGYGGRRVHESGLESEGRLPPEVIQRVVRSHFGRYRSCYEHALRANPVLAGRVSLRFVIGRDGSVLQVQDAGSELPDRDVVGCVARVFYGLSFPEPAGGIVTVVYPILFSPT